MALLLFALPQPSGILVKPQAAQEKSLGPGTQALGADQLLLLLITMVLNFPGSLMKAIDLLPRKTHPSIHAPNFAGNFRYLCSTPIRTIKVIGTHSCISKDSCIIYKSKCKMEILETIVEKVLKS